MPNFLKVKHDPTLKTMPPGILRFIVTNFTNEQALSIRCLECPVGAFGGNGVPMGTSYPVPDNRIVTS